MTGTLERGNMRSMRRNSAAQGSSRASRRRVSANPQGRSVQGRREILVNLPERKMPSRRRASTNPQGRSVQGRREISVNLPERSMQDWRRQAAYPSGRGMQSQRRVSAYPPRSMQGQRIPADRRRGVSKKQQARRRRMQLYRRLKKLFMLVLLVGIFLGGKSYYEKLHMPAWNQKEGEGVKAVPDVSLMAGEEEPAPRIREDFLSISEYNRPGTELSAVNNIFVHYTANPKTSAAQNRSYFENLAQTHERAASAHFIIGYNGEIIQCIPLEEEAYAVIGRNNDSISIECCYISEDGAFTQETYDSLIWLLASLTEQYDLNAQDILRHYDCGGKLCPLYYVEHEDAWRKLLSDVEQYPPEEAKASFK